MSDLAVPTILRLCQERESAPRPLPPRPTWEESAASTRLGVWQRSEDRWWQRLAFRLLGERAWMLSPFWGWQKL